MVLALAGVRKMGGHDRCRPGQTPEGHLACFSPCSLPDHPISQLLKKLQCAVYSALYPVVSRAAVSAVPAPGSCSLPPEANGLLAPGSRRLRSSQSLYCMLCPPEPSTAPRALDGPPPTPSVPTLHSEALDREADGSPAGPSSPLLDALSHLPDKDSSFEDLEQFLALSEPQTPGAKREPLLECLKSTVKDIHNAIGEPAGHRTCSNCVCQPSSAACCPGQPRPLSTHPQEQAFSPEEQALVYLSAQTVGGAGVGA